MVILFPACVVINVQLSLFQVLPLSKLYLK